MNRPDDFCPYVGLRPFTKDDRRYFFGRQREQRVIFSNLAASPLTVLYGPSGTGKSSVLQAGLLPMVRVHSRRTAIVYFNRWQDAGFLDSLKAQCIAEARRVARRKDFTVDAALPLDVLVVQLQRHLSRSMLVVLDQFEEYLLYHPETQADRPFERQLAHSIAQHADAVSFLIALREDSLSRLDRFRTRIPNLLGNTLRLQALNARGAEEAIREPLEVYRRRHAGAGGPVAIEDELVKTVLREIRSVHTTQLSGSGNKGAPALRAESDEIEAAILQLVMTRLWEAEREAGSSSLRLETLEKLQGASHIVATHFSRVMEKFTADECTICAGIFRFLVTPSGTKIAYSPEYLADRAECPVEGVRNVLAKLVANSVLRKIDAPERYELLHDILASAIDGWRTRFVERQKSMLAAAEREEQLAAVHRSRQLKLAVAVASILVVVAVMTGVVGWKAHLAGQQRKRDLAQLVALKFQEAALKSPPNSGKDLQFLLRARGILETNFQGELKHEKLAAVDARLARALGTWSLPATTTDFAFITPDNAKGHLVSVDLRNLTWWDLRTRQSRQSTDLAAVKTSQGTAVTLADKISLLGVTALSRDGRRVALNRVSNQVLWDLRTDERTAIASSGRERILVRAFSDVDDRLLVSRGSRLEVWEGATEKSAKPVAEVFDPADLSFRAGTSHILVRQQGALRLKDLNASRGASLREFRGKGAISAFALSANGMQVAFADGEAIRHVRLDTDASEPRVLATMGQDWRAIAFDRAGQRLAAFRGDGRVFVWDLATGHGRSPIELAAAKRAVFSHDLAWVATFAADAPTIYALNPPANVLAAARERVKDALTFDDVIAPYHDLTEKFREGVTAARESLEVRPAAEHFREALAIFRDIDPALRFDPEDEARRLTADGFAARAQAQAGRGDALAATKDYNEALKLNPALSREPLDRFRVQALSVRLRAAEAQEAAGNLEGALAELRGAREFGPQIVANRESVLQHKLARARLDEARRNLERGDRPAATRLFAEALQLSPTLRTSVNPQRELAQAEARELLRNASAHLKENRFGQAIRQFAAAQRLLGVTGQIAFADSSALAGAGYDAANQAMTITFRSGEVYRYKAVPRSIYDGLLRSASKGTYFTEHVRGKFSFERSERVAATSALIGDAVSLGGFGGELLSATDQALERTPGNRALQQTRGVARALMGDYGGAAEGLDAFAADPANANTDFARQNREWARQLRDGTNPFTPDVLEKLPPL